MMPDEVNALSKVARSLGVISGETAEELIAALVEAQRERDEWKRALEGLTPSGSEYVNDPAACVAFVRSVRESQHSALSRFKKRADAAESELARVRPVVQAAEAWFQDDPSMHGCSPPCGTTECALATAVATYRAGEGS